MACFAVPLAEAILVTAVKAVLAHKRSADGVVKASHDESGKITFKEKIGWLQKMLFGGSGLLLFAVSILLQKKTVGRRMYAKSVS